MAINLFEGGGKVQVTMTAGDTLTAGDRLYLDSDGKLYPQSAVTGSYSFSTEAIEVAAGTSTEPPSISWDADRDIYAICYTDNSTESGVYFETYTFNGTAWTAEDEQEIDTSPDTITLVDWIPGTNIFATFGSSGTAFSLGMVEVGDDGTIDHYLTPSSISLTVTSTTYPVFKGLLADGKHPGVIAGGDNSTTRSLGMYSLSRTYQDAGWGWDPIWTDTSVSNNGNHEYIPSTGTRVFGSDIGDDPSFVEYEMTSSTVIQQINTHGAVQLDSVIYTDTSVVKHPYDDTKVIVVGYDSTAGWLACMGQFERSTGGTDAWDYEQVFVPNTSGAANFIGPTFVNTVHDFEAKIDPCSGNLIIMVTNQVDDDAKMFEVAVNWETGSLVEGSSYDVVTNEWYCVRQRRDQTVIADQGRLAFVYKDTSYDIQVNYTTVDSYTYKPTQFVGLAASNAVADGNVTVDPVVGNVGMTSFNSEQSDLTPQEYYYLDWDGSLTTENTTNVLVGLALSDTELMLTDQKVSYNRNPVPGVHTK